MVGKKLIEQGNRSLLDLVSVGLATVADLRVLGITTVEQLRGRDAAQLHRELCDVTGVAHDICMQDIFAAAIAQAENPTLPTHQRQWHWWSRHRKAHGERPSSSKLERDEPSNTVTEHDSRARTTRG